MKEFRGSYVVNITPMTDDEEVDYKGLRENIDWYINDGIAGICVMGSTGEFLCLSKEERKRVAEATVEHINGRVPCLVGTAEESTRATIEYTKHAQDIGADGVLIINPYYCRPSENEIYEHYKAVSKATNIPIMAYNNPFTSGVDIRPELLAKICEMDNIDYVKDASGDIRRVRDIIRLSNGKAKVFCGGEDIPFESFVLGAVGWISVVANIVPGMSQKLFDLVQENEIAMAKAVFQKILPMLDFLEKSGKWVQVIKAAVNKIGHAGGPCRLPRLPLTVEENATLDKILKEMGLLTEK